MGDIARAYDAALGKLQDRLSLKDRPTGGHSHRVAAFSIALARRMGLPSDQIRVIARGAYLHDIGKMAIPDAILRKPGPLVGDEIAVMREHAYHGYQMVKTIPFLAGEASEIVYAHHERWDGSGYPRGLKGEEIPLGARIVAVANTLDSIMSDHPYRRAQSWSAAREEIDRWTVRQFDPEIVNVFREMPDNVWGDLRREILSNKW